jgi:nucleoside-diphosphate-sugar epimerase
VQQLGAEAIRGDLLQASTPTIGEWVRGTDAIVNVATALGKHPEAPSADALNRTGELRTRGTRLLLQAALGLGVRRYIQESIELAYPDCADEWIDEAQPLDTASSRAIVCGPVIEMEDAVAKAHHAALQCSILRGGRLTGADTAQVNAVEALRSGALRVAGDGSHFISPVHVKDYARAIVLALESPDPPLVVNVNAQPVREGVYYDMLADALGVMRPRRDEQRASPPSHRCSNALAASSLGWAPKEPLIEGGLINKN